MLSQLRLGIPLRDFLHDLSGKEQRPRRRQMVAVLIKNSVVVMRDAPPAVPFITENLVRINADNAITGN